MGSPVAMWTYAAAAAAFLFLSVLLITSWRGRFAGMLLAAGSLATVVWAAAAAYPPPQQSASGFWLLAAPLLEIVRSAIWLLLLLVLVGYTRKQVGILRYATLATLAFCGVLLIATVVAGGVPTVKPGAFGILGRLVLSVVGMVL